MRSNITYVLNTKTGRFVIANGRVGRDVVQYPHCSIRIDDGVIRVSTPAHNLTVASDNMAREVCWAYHADAARYYAIVRKLATT